MTPEGREELEQSPNWLDHTDAGTVMDVFERKREADRAADAILAAPRKLSSGMFNHFSRAVKVDRWDPAENLITGTDALTGEAVSIRAATASDYAEKYMNKNQYPLQEDRLHRAEALFEKTDRFGAIHEGEVVVLRNVRGFANDGRPTVGMGGIKDYRYIPMFQQSEVLSDDVADEVNRRLELKKPQAAPEPAPKPKPAPRRDTSHDRDDDLKPS